MKLTKVEATKIIDIADAITIALPSVLRGHSWVIEAMSCGGNFALYPLPIEGVPSRLTISYQLSLFGGSDGYSSPIGTLYVSDDVLKERCNKQ